MGVVVPQVLRSYNNIEEDCTVCPSWCLTLQVRGHSYCPGLEHHIPQYTLDAPKVSVAPAAVGGGTEGLALPSDPSPISGGLRSTSSALPGHPNLPTTSPWGSAPVLKDCLLDHCSGTAKSLRLGPLALACSI